MKPDNLPPNQSIMACLLAAFQVITKQMPSGQAFYTSVSAFWQVIIVEWLLGLFVSLSLVTINIIQNGQIFLFQITPAMLLDMNNLMQALGASIISTISSLSFALIIWYILLRWGREIYFLSFLIPFLWLNVLYLLFFNIVFLFVFVSGNSNFILLAILPVIWILVCQFQIVRDHLKISVLAALGVLLLRPAVSLFVAQIAGGLLFTEYAVA